MGTPELKRGLWETSTQWVFHTGWEPSPWEILLSFPFTATGKWVWNLVSWRDRHGGRDLTAKLSRWDRNMLQASRDPERGRQRAEASPPRNETLRKYTPLQGGKWVSNAQEGPAELEAMWGPLDGSISLGFFLILPNWKPAAGSGY